jgi:hypothetical protein
MTAVDEVSQTFEQALARDAGIPQRQAPPEVPPPPERDPDAPHGRDGDGKPLAPFGHKADGSPRIKPPGPGRPKSAVVVTPPPSPSGQPGGKNYADELTGLATSVWLGASSLKGGRLGPLRLPDTRPYAVVWHQQTPQMVAAWAAACDQNPTIRGYVDKMSGDGSWSWVIGVGIASVGLMSSIAEMAKAPPELKAQATAYNDQRLQEFIKAQVEALGLETEEDQ